MGTVYRKTVTKPLPTGAELFTKAGERFARWKDAKGKSRTAPVTIGRDGAERIEITARTFTAKYRDGQGIVREVATGCRDEQAARAVLAGLTKRAENVRSGIVTAADDSIIDHAATPLGIHFDEYIANLLGQDISKVHRENVGRTLKRVARECHFEKLAEITAENFERWLRAQQLQKKSARTRNYYRNVWVAFCNWCVLTYRLAANPLERVTRADEQIDRRRQRRAMNEAELVKLLEVARWRPLAEYGRRSVAKDEIERQGKRSNWTLAPLTLDELPAAVERARHCLAKRPEFITKLERLGHERALIYKTLVLTGLRKGELASLTIGQLHLDGPHPFAELHATDEKNRQGSQIAIRDDLAADLREWINGKQEAQATARVGCGAILSMKPNADRLPANERLFVVPAQLVRILDRDLQAAGIAKTDERGRTLDVHALRHSFGTLLSRGGVAPRTAQSAMRHSSIDLTMNVYTDPKLLDVHGALDSLPVLPISSSPFKAPETERATGTNDLRQTQFAPAFAPTLGKPRQTPSHPGKYPALSDALEQHRRHAASVSGAKENGSPETTSREPRKERATGFEPATSSLGSNSDLVLTGNRQALTASENAVCTSVCTSEPQNTLSPALDAELQTVLELWPKLSPAARSAIAAMVQATAKPAG